MFFRCENCKKDVEAGLVRESLVSGMIGNNTEAKCLECSGTLSLSKFVKQSLLTMQKFYTIPIKKEAFSFKCESCKKVNPAILDGEGKQALCIDCKTPFKLSAIMINAIRISKNGSIDPS